MPGVSKKRLFLILGAVAVVAVIIVIGMNQGGKKGAEVSVAAVEKKQLTEQVSASGRVQPQTKVNITSEVNGEVIDLKVKEGDTVRQGQLLIVLDTTRLRSDVDQARFAMSETEARLNGAKTMLDQATEEYQRQEKLYAEKLTSETQFKNAKYEHLNSQSGYEAMLAQSKQLRSAFDKQMENFRKAKIVAPMDGIVTLVDVEVGEVAAAQTSFTQGKTLMTISNLDAFEVQVEVDETEVTKIKVGQKAEIEVDAFPDTTFSGRVIEIGNSAIVSGMGTQEQSTDFKVTILFTEVNDRIRPGMSATVDITTEERNGALALPFSCVVARSWDLDSLTRARERRLTEKGGVEAATDDSAEQKKDDETDRKDLKGVFVVRDGKVEFVEVTTGIADRKSIEILTGIKEGDSVVSGSYSALRNLTDGEEVKVRDDEKNKKSSDGKK